MSCLYDFWHGCLTSYQKFICFKKGAALRCRCCAVAPKLGHLGHVDAFTFSQTLYWRDVAVAHVFKKLKLRAVAVAPLHQKGEACGRRCCAVAPKLRHLGDVGVCTIYKAFSYRDVAVATFFNKVELCAVAVAPLHRN